ncbi:MAG: hypothetical protein ACU0CA_11585 [Paracoccaceae bacterium]
MKRIISVTSTIAMVASLTVTPASANDDTANAIAGIIALGVLGAAISEHQHRRGYDEYVTHPRLHPDENAIGRCMHKGKRAVKKAGGYRMELENVNSIIVGKDGATHISFVATGYYPIGHKTSDVICVVKNGKVTSFNFN